ncbi:hypothetical protein Tco_0547479 [Tanacetum coccineum]
MTANRISPTLDLSWVDEILRFMKPVGYRPTMLLLCYCDRKESLKKKSDESLTILRVLFLSRQLSLRKVISIPIGGSINFEGFLSSILLVVVIIITVLIVVVILVVVIFVIVEVVIVVVNRVLLSDSIPLGMLMASPKFEFRYGKRVSSMIISTLCHGSKSMLPSGCSIKISSRLSDGIQVMAGVSGCLNVLLGDNVVEEEDGEWIRFLGGNSSSGIEKYRELNSRDGGNIEDGVKIAGGVIGSYDEIEFSEELKELRPAKAGK